MGVPEGYDGKASGVTARATAARGRCRDWHWRMPGPGPAVGCSKRRSRRVVRRAWMQGHASPGVERGLPRFGGGWRATGRRLRERREGFAWVQSGARPATEAAIAGIDTKPREPLAIVRPEGRPTGCRPSPPEPWMASVAISAWHPVASCRSVGEGAFFGYFLCTSKESDSGASAHETLLLLLADAERSGRRRSMSQVLLRGVPSGPTRQCRSEVRSSSRKRVTLPAPRSARGVRQRRRQCRLGGAGSPT